MTRGPARTRTSPPAQAPARVIIDNVRPQVDQGRFPSKSTVGERVQVTARIYADGHDELGAVLLYREADAKEWTETPLELVEPGTDLWRGHFPVSRIGQYCFTVEAWTDRFKTWRRDLRKKVDAGQDVSVDLLVGAQMVAEAAGRASGEDRERLRFYETALAGTNKSGQGAAVEAALDNSLARLMGQQIDRAQAARFEKELRVEADRAKARFSSWYEVFPRSCSPVPGRHGTFADLEKRLPYIAGMGFDVLYLPPIHPIGRTNRKGKNNNPVATADDVGSPWAIGASEGGHKAIHPQLGTLEDFKRLLAAAEKHGLEVALDIAFQCTPDHPYVKEHPEWFRRRPDGSVQYAENPPKKYEDIYPLDFENGNWKELWQELKSVVLYWIEQGVRIFRVDNPHTKPFAFWEWLITEVKKDCPEVLFLSEAFTRPSVKYFLAKAGFSHSYTYFAWRNTKSELTEYFTELSVPDWQACFRPHLWPNTPDILTEYLQFGGRPAFMTRLTLAATLGANYGIYGPAFELCENRPRSPGSEEYLDSEKYEIRHWDIGRPDSLREFIARLNRIRRENPALQRDDNLRFHWVDNDQLIAYSKVSPDLSNALLVVVNLDPHHTQSGWVELPTDFFDLAPGQTYQMHDLLSDARYFWQGSRNYVELNPGSVPAHIFRLRRRIRTERDFDYFL